MIPIVTAANGFGTPVTPVTSDGVPATIATNGLGVPVVFVESGGAPMVVDGGMVPWTPTDGNFPYWFDISDLATITLASSKIAALANKGSAGGSLAQASTLLQPPVNTADLNGYTTATVGSSNGEYLEISLTLPVGWSAFIVYASALFGAQSSVSLLAADGASTVIPLGSDGDASANRWACDGVTFNSPGPDIWTNDVSQAWLDRDACHAGIATGVWQATLINGIAAKGPGTALTWGAKPVTANGYNGKAVELVIKTSAFTTDERQRLFGRAAWKYGGALLSGLNPSSPYKNAPPMT